MAMEFERPKFLPSFLELLRREAEAESWLALCPYGLLICGALGACAAWFVPQAFWDKDQWPVSTVVYTGIMTLDGLILALGWNAFGRVYDRLFGGEFGLYLYEKKLLNNYLVHIGVLHWSQASAVIFSGAALVLVLIDNIPLALQRCLFALVILSSAYAVKQAVAAIRMMNDLVWQANVYDGWRNRDKAGLRPVQGGKS